MSTKVVGVETTIMVQRRVGRIWKDYADWSNLAETYTEADLVKNLETLHRLNQGKTFRILHSTITHKIETTTHTHTETRTIQ